MPDRSWRPWGVLLLPLAIGLGCATGAPTNPGGGGAEADAQAEDPAPKPPAAPRADARAPDPAPTVPESPPATDPAPARADAGTTSPPASPAARDGGAPADPPAAGDYPCTMIIGINATAEWYDRGYETLVDNAKWELIRVHSGFVNLWADPKNAVWATKPSSPCTKNALDPDRVIFVGLEFDFTTVAQWLPNLTAVVKNLQDKYPGVKRIELATFVRAPGNKPCPQAPAKRSTIAPAEDEAIEMVVKANPELVIASPRFEAASCSEFSGNPPHPSAAGGAAWAKMIAAHYGPGR
jgi:hypothetical protein